MPSAPHFQPTRLWAHQSSPPTKYSVLAGPPGPHGARPGGCKSPGSWPSGQAARHSHSSRNKYPATSTEPPGPSVDFPRPLGPGLPGHICHLQRDWGQHHGKLLCFAERLLGNVEMLLAVSARPQKKARRAHRPALNLDGASPTSTSGLFSICPLRTRRQTGRLKTLAIDNVH